MYIWQQAKYPANHQKMATNDALPIYHFPIDNGPWCPLGQRLSKKPKKLIVFCDFYISICVDISSRFTSSSTDKYNAYNN